MLLPPAESISSSLDPALPAAMSADPPMALPTPPSPAAVRRVFTHPGDHSHVDATLARGRFAGTTPGPRESQDPIQGFQ